MSTGKFSIFKRYWAAYGGTRALLRSVYLLVAVVVLLPLTAHTWLMGKWWEQSLSVLPNLLGFSLGGFAIFIGFGDDKFKQLLAAPDEEQPSAVSPYVELCATFVHFILVQSFALVAALLASALQFECELPTQIDRLMPVLNAMGGALGYGLFLYAVTLLVAATMQVFSLATMYDRFQSAPVRECPACLDVVPAAASRCRSCGSDLSQP